jgi:subtilisin family serine protease
MAPRQLSGFFALHALLELLRHLKPSCCGNPVGLIEGGIYDMPPRLSALDARTASILTRFTSGEVGLATLPLSTLGARFTETGSMAGKPPKSSAVTLKLLVDPGTEDETANAIEKGGGEIVSRGARVLIANLDVAKIGSLENLTGVRRVEAPQEMHVTLDNARGPITHLDEAIALPGAATGKGVVVGIIDSGVDWSHPDFIDDAGESRLELFVYARRLPNSLLSETVEFDRAELNAALKAGSGKKKVPIGDPNGHGTHCASIAAGNGRASGGRFRGVAREATLIGIRSEPLLDAHIIEGIRRIFAQAEGRPTVINLSLGVHLGAHDGTAAIENAIARESGPGRIIVVAAGNEGADQIHWSGTLKAGEDLVIQFRVMDPSSQFVDVWIPRGDEVDIVIEDPDGNQFHPDGKPQLGSAGELIADWRVDRVNLDQNLTVFIAGGAAGSRWHIRMTPTRVIHGEVHAWAGTSDPGVPQSIFPATGDFGYTVGIPATEERAISVASFVSRGALGAGAAGRLQVGALSSFSSLGPSRAGEQRPDIAAPGQFITAALAAKSQLATDSRLAPRRDASGHYITIQGTSMAAPFVTGVIALMLEREPKLDPSEVRQRLRATADRDELVGRVWDRGFGHGRINVAELLKYRST